MVLHSACGLLSIHSFIVKCSVLIQTHIIIHTANNQIVLTVTVDHFAPTAIMAFGDPFVRLEGREGGRGRGMGG